MAYYLVRARLENAKAEDLYRKLNEGFIEEMRPFGKTLTNSLLCARVDPDSGEVLWEEEDYCSPPLKQEREAVLDHYFDDLEVQNVSGGEGWKKIRHLPSLWEHIDVEKR